MNTLKKIAQSTMILAMGSLVLVSCSDDDEEDPTPSKPTVRIITGEETWSADEVVTLDGKVVVEDGGKLTIEPGTIIKAAAGQGTTASALIIARGGMIDAEGDADNPIIFTSASDNIEVGQTAGTNLEREDNQLWGGVIILGRAPISAENGDDESNIEGIPAEAGYGKYGGDDEEDDSGVFKFVSIRHGGISIGDGNEINGLTLGGVGTDTEISDVEIYGTLDDGIECFGGTVDIDNALVYYQGDDGLDLDQNYSGTISNFAVIHGDGIGTDESLEIDGPEGSTYTDGKFTLMNGFCIIEGEDGSAADFKSKAQGFVENVTFMAGGKEVKFRTKFDDNCDHGSDAYQNLLDGDLTFTDCDIEDGVEVYDANADDENPTTCPDELAASQTTADGEVTQDGAGSSLDYQSVFSWTCAGERGEL